MSTQEQIDKYVQILRDLVTTAPESQRVQREAMRAERSALDAWIAAHPDVLVTIEDSLRVRHCRPGTEAFRDQHFPGRESVTVAELAPLAASDERVRLVLASVMSRSGDATLQAASTIVLGVDP